MTKQYIVVVVEDGSEYDMIHPDDGVARASATSMVVCRLIMCLLELDRGLERLQHGSYDRTEILNEIDRLTA